jgi:hypothetical protein
VPEATKFCPFGLQGARLNSLAAMVRIYLEGAMPVYLIILGVLATTSCLSWSASFAASGVWKFGTEDRGHPELVYLENNKTIFMVACGRAFGLHAVYPGAPKKDGEKASITIANVKTQMKFDGEIDSSYPDDPPNTTHFLQWDLGFKRQDPDLFGKKWKIIEYRLFDLLDSGQPLTILAENKSYSLPAVKIPDWKVRFKKAC